MIFVPDISRLLQESVPPSDLYILWVHSAPILRVYQLNLLNRTRKTFSCVPINLSWTRYCLYNHPSQAPGSFSKVYDHRYHHQYIISRMAKIFFQTLQRTEGENVVNRFLNLLHKVAYSALSIISFLWGSTIHAIMKLLYLVELLFHRLSSLTLPPSDEI